MDPDLQDIIHQLAESQREALSILKLSEDDDVLASSSKSKNPNVDGRTSDASDAVTGHSPAFLEAELTAYKELFSKLRFNYMEQVAKEKFLGAITDDPPQLVERSDIAELEEEVARKKGELQKVKAEVKAIFEEIEEVGRRVCEEYQKTADRVARTLQLPLEISTLEAEVSSLMHLDSSNPDFHQHLPLGETLSQLAQAETELTRIQREIDVANRNIPSKQRRLDALDRELKPLETNKQGVVAFAEEAVKRREEERQRGLANRENTGRWYRGAESALAALMGEYGDSGGDGVKVEGKPGS